MKLHTTSGRDLIAVKYPSRNTCVLVCTLPHKAKETFSVVKIYAWNIFVIIFFCVFI